jgi:hypothetical protein
VVATIRTQIVLLALAPIMPVCEPSRIVVDSETVNIDADQ